MAEDELDRGGVVPGFDDLTGDAPHLEEVAVEALPSTRGVNHEDPVGRRLDRRLVYREVVIVALLQVPDEHDGRDQGPDRPDPSRDPGAADVKGDQDRAVGDRDQRQLQRHPAASEEVARVEHGPEEEQLVLAGSAGSVSRVVDAECHADDPEGAHGVVGDRRKPVAEQPDQPGRE